MVMASTTKKPWVAVVVTVIALIVMGYLIWAQFAK